MTPISETELNAYVDGEVFPGRRAIIEAWLARNPPEAARVQAWRRQNQVLRSAFGRILAEPLPAALVDIRPDKAANDRGVVAFVPLSPQTRVVRAQAWDRRDRVALIAAASFLAGAAAACLGGLLAGFQ
jgi:anti-sigma factor RsiW